MPTMVKRYILLTLTVLTLLAFGLRVLSLDAQSMWRDEIDTLCFALDFWETLERTVGTGQEASLGSAELSLPSSEHPHCQPAPGLSQVDPSDGLWPTLRALLTLPGWNGPLYTVAMRPWIGLTGDTPFALRYSSLCFGLLAVPLTYAVGRRLLGASAGLVGATLVASSPHLVWYSQEAKMYALILALGLLAIYGLRRALEGDGGARWWIVVVVATTLALYSHILTALLIPLQVVLCLVWWPHTRRHWRAALVALACLTLPYVPLLVWQARSWLRPAGQATLFAARGPDEMLSITLNGWAGNFVGEPWATAILVGLVLLALCGLAWAWLSGGGRSAVPVRGSKLGCEPLALSLWATLPLLGLWLISARQPLFTNRYLVWAAPAFYLLVAGGAVALARLGHGGVLIAGGLLAVVLVGDGRAVLYQAGQPIKPDFRAAAVYLDERYGPGDVVIFHLSYMQHNFDFYFEGDYEGWGAPAPAGGMSESDFDSLMRTITSGHETAWLVLSEADMWDPQGFVKAWLDAHAKALPEEQVFKHVSVYRYRMRDG